MAFVSQPRNFTVDKRVPWGGANGEADIVVLGLDWSAGTYLMEVRPEPGNTSAALLSIANASAGAQGVSVSYEAGYLHPKTGAVVGATIIRPQINETSLESLSYGADPADPVTLFYDIHATVSGRGKFVLMAGKFIIQPGVTL
ncbi:MAG: hypothetical protein CL575_01635 [Altererythrobacter sp.]|nr:hypothetical protein [Altererythrobacter sp.]|tara:strand:- start:10581 stop:11009 length:429 start_codon:yes stop_codon:yes gene_type:complete